MIRENSRYDAFLGPGTAPRHYSGHCEQRSLAAVLKTIIDAVARQPDVALARLWLREADESCPVCSADKLTVEPALHLRASAGTPISEAADWTRTNGTFHRIPLTSSNLKIAHIATTGESIRIAASGRRSSLGSPSGVGASREVWQFCRPCAGISGRASGCSGGVSPHCWPMTTAFNWLRTMASAAAVAIANARAFEDNERCASELEERDYLREEVKSSGAFGEILGRQSRARSASCIKWRWSRRHRC